MDYLKHYELIISRAKNRTLEGYTEKHHIVPKCMGGTDDKENIAVLTAREHYVAHQLLAMAYPDSVGLSFAAYMMSNNPQQNTKINSKTYSWIRANYANKARINNTGQVRTPEQRLNMKTGWLLMSQEDKLKHSENLSKSLTGRSLSKDHCVNISQAKKGIPFSEEAKLNMSLAQQARIRPLDELKRFGQLSIDRTGIPLSEDHKAKIAKSLIGGTRSDETKAKMSLARIGKPLKESTKIKLSLLNTGKTHSDETKAKISKLHKGKIVSDKTKAKMSEGIKNANVLVKCPHCKKEGKLTGMKSWHFDNCKENPNGIVPRKIYASKQRKI